MWTRVPRDLVNITPHIPRRVESNVSRIVPSFLSFPDNLSPWACHLIKTVFLNISLPSAKHSLLKPSVYCSLPFTNASPEAQFPVHAHRHIKKAIYSLTAEARKTGSVHRYLGCGFHWPLHSKCEVCVCVCLSVCKRERACVCICMYTCVCTAHVSVCVSVHTYVCLCVYIGTLCTHTGHLGRTFHSIIFSFSVGIYSNPSIQDLQYLLMLPTSSPQGLWPFLLASSLWTGVSQQTHCSPIHSDAPAG